jgi:DNA mismatch endonuclease, patch repair protein
VFPERKSVVFADGDFWHGRNLKERLNKLAGGNNGAYWVKKISTNVARDRRIRSALKANGWAVLRVWESDINKDPHTVARRVDRWLSTTADQATRPARTAARQRAASAP